MPTTGLRRGIGPVDFIALIINITLGAGILGLPAKLYVLVGSWSLVAYGISAIIVVLIVLCFAEVSSRFSGTGGPYLYTRFAYGSLIGFQVGWLFWLSRVAAFASICNLFVNYAALFRPQLASGWERAGVITVLVVSLALLNYLGVQRSARVNTVFAIAKVVAIGGFAVTGLFFIKARTITWSVPPAYAPFSQAVFLLIFTFSGFDVATIPAGEVQRPQRTVPVALLIAIGVVTGLFIAVQLVCIGTLPALASSERPLADAAFQFMGPVGSQFITVVALITALGTLHALMLTGPRLVFAMAQQNQLPRWLASIHARHQTPYIAILLTASLQLWLALTGTFLYALTLSTLIRLIYFALVSAALPLLRLRTTVPPAQFRLAGGVVVSTLAVLLCLGLLGSTSAAEVRDIAIALVVGLVVFGVGRPTP